MVKVFWVWRNKEALKIECNKRNCNRDSNLNRISNVFLIRTRLIFEWMVNYLANFPFLDPFFYIFDKFSKTKCRTFLRMALNHCQNLKLKLRNVTLNCPCQLCKTYWQNIGFIWTWRMNYKRFSMFEKIVFYHLTLNICYYFK